MKQLIFIALMSLMSLTLYGQTNSTVGGAGVCNVDQDPDNIPDMMTQDERYECILAFDEDNQIMYVYDGSLTSGNRWVDFTTYVSTATDTDTRLDNLTLNGTDLDFDVLDVVNSSVLSSGSVDLSSLVSDVQDVVGGTDITVTNSGGTYTVNNDAPDQVVSMTGGTNVTVTGTYPNFTVAVNSLDDADADPTNEIQTVTGGDGITATNDGSDNYTIDNDEASQGDYKNHADAASGGVAIGEYFTTSTDNTMGMPAGTKVKRVY